MRRRMPPPINLSGLDPDTALHVRIFQRLREHIVAGSLPPGGPLPSTRGLADSLRVSRGSVVAAYERLQADGWITTRQGSGAIVAERPPLQATPRARLPRCAEAPPFAMGVPALDLFPLVTWNRLQSRRWRSMPRTALQEGPSTGWQGLREAIAGYLALARGLRVEPRQVIVINSLRSGLDLTIRALGLAGAAGVVEDPAYFGFTELLRLNGVRCLPRPVDAYGMADPAIGVSEEARFALVSPACQFPTGFTMAPGRREALLNWISEGRWLIEEDHDWEWSDAPRPLAVSAPASTVYLHSFSRVLFPSLRISCVIPPLDRLEEFARARASMDGHSNTPNQMVLADFLSQGHYEDHIRRCREAYGERREAFMSAAAALSEQIHLDFGGSGMQVRGHLRAGSSEAIVLQAAACAGVELEGGSRFRQSIVNPPEVYFGFGGYSRAAIQRGVQALRSALRDLPRAA
jgi:GntR family transcriptional regulator / MocR family aminotransferase